MLRAYLVEGPSAGGDRLGAALAPQRVPAVPREVGVVGVRGLILIGAAANVTAATNP